MFRVSTSEARAASRAFYFRRLLIFRSGREICASRTLAGPIWGPCAQRSSCNPQGLPLGSGQRPIRQPAWSGLPRRPGPFSGDEAVAWPGARLPQGTRFGACEPEGQSAAVAQLVRALDCGSRGHWFESSQRYQYFRTRPDPHQKTATVARRAQHPATAWGIRVPSNVDSAGNFWGIQPCAFSSLSRSSFLPLSVSAVASAIMKRPSSLSR